jgi:small subunit ribosomal protein S16
MATRIRLRRMGAKKRPHYRVVVADQRAPRDGRFIENIGKYHPLEERSLSEIDEDRALHRLRTGEQPSEQVQNLLNKVGIWEKFAAERPATAAKVNSKDKKVREGKPEAAKTSKKAQKKAVEAAAAPPEAKVEAPAAAPAKAETPEPEPSPAAEPAEAVEPAEVVETAEAAEAPAASDAPEAAEEATPEA